MEEMVGVYDAQTNPEKAKNKTVKWGGTIAAIKNLADGTQVEIVSRPLTDFGRPYETDRSDGRFRANLPQFLDPQVYAPGREVTVNGTVSGLENDQVGQFNYSFPLIAATTIHLWKKRKPEPCCEDNYWRYDPWLSPWLFNRPHRKPIRR